MNATVKYERLKLIDINLSMPKEYNDELDDSAFLRTQSYITEICYFEFLWSFEFWLAPHWDFFFKRSAYLPQYTYKVDQNQN